MSKCDFISAQTSAHAVDAVAVDLASVLAAMIVRWGAALQSKGEWEEKNPQLAAICEADAEFYNHVAHAVLDVMAKCCPDVDLIRYVRSRLADEEVVN